MSIHWTNKDMERLYEIISNSEEKGVDYMQRMSAGGFVNCMDDAFYTEYDLSSPLQAMSVLDKYLDSEWDKDLLKVVTVCLFRNENTTKSLESRIPDFIYNF